MHVMLLAPHTNIITKLLKWDRKHSDVCTFSFHPLKPITTGVAVL